MADSMIERVARALAKNKGCDPDEAARDDVRTGYGHEPLATFPTRPRWHEYISDAMAAIRAMHEPTREMLDAGFLAKPGKDGLIPPVHAWPAMIEAALAEDGR